jgi:hypothetical protein
MTVFNLRLAAKAKKILLTGLVFAVASCSAQEAPTAVQAPKPKITEAKTSELPNPNDEKVVVSDAQPQRSLVSGEIQDKPKACRAVIASLNGRSFDTIRDNGSFVGNQSVRYARDTDGKVFRYACRFRGNNAMWAMIDERGAGTGIGAWAGDGSGLRTIKVTESGSKVVVEIIWQDGNREKYDY